MSHRKTLERALRCFADPQNRQDYFQLYSDDIVLHGYSGVGAGLQNVKRFYYGFWQIFPDAKVTAEEVIEQGDRLAVRHVTTGTQHATFMGVVATGQKIELPGISILHFKSGACFERWTCSDSLLLLQQIGVSVTPTQ